MRHEVRFALDSPLEGTGFELPVRGRGESGFGPFCVAPDCLFAFCLRRILRDLESIERGRQREGRIIDVGPDGIDPATSPLAAEQALSHRSIALTLQQYQHN